MFKLSYSTNGLTNLDFFTAVKEVEKAGFEGVELSFQYKQFDPFTFTDDNYLEIKNFFSKSRIKPACISTATAIFLSDIPHEPSLLSLESDKRKQRIELIRKGICIAKKIGVPIVSFQSGYLRKEHSDNLSISPYELLVKGIGQCLEDIGDIQLVIEPEPGMFIETIEQAINLINDVNNPRFGLHVDIGHTYCTEEDYVGSIAKAIPYIKYMHLADIKEGFNLKLICTPSYGLKPPEINLDHAGYLLYVIEKDEFMFIDKNNTIYFYNDNLQQKEKDEIINFARQLNSNVDTTFVMLENVNKAKISIDINLEIKAFIGSVAGIDFNVLDKAVPILNYLRSSQTEVGKQVITKPVCNTVNGKVHYHEFPGKGEINFNAVLTTLKNNNYAGYVTIELYNHSDVWESVLSQSRKYLLDCMTC